MTSHKHQDVQHDGDNTQLDNNVVGQRLLDDIQGKFYVGSTKPEAVQQLVKNGILPEGSTFIDFGAVKTGLTSDQQKLKMLEGQAPADVDGLTKAVTDSTTAQQAAQTKLDAAAAKADPLQARIDGRTKQDEQVKKDFATLCKAMDTDILDKADVASLAFDLNKSQAVRDAGKNLMSTFHDATRPMGRGKIITHYTANDYTGNRAWSGKPYFDQESLDAGFAKHERENAADRKLLVPLASAKNEAKVAKDAADNDLMVKQSAFKNADTQGQNLETEKTKLTERIHEQQKLLTPQGEIEKLGRVVRGGGYYQVAENLLGLKSNSHTDLQEKQLKMLTNLLKEEAKELNGGQLPKYLVKDDQLLKPENLHRVLDKLKRGIQPSQPAEKKVIAPIKKAEEKDIVFE